MVLRWQLRPFWGAPQFSWVSLCKQEVYVLLNCFSPLNLLFTTRSSQWRNQKGRGKINFPPPQKLESLERTRVPPSCLLQSFYVFISCTSFLFSQPPTFFWMIGAHKLKSSYSGTVSLHSHCFVLFLLARQHTTWWGGGQGALLGSLGSVDLFLSFSFSMTENLHPFPALPHPHSPLARIA